MILLPHFRFDLRLRECFPSPESCVRSPMLDRGVLWVRGRGRNVNVVQCWHSGTHNVTSREVNKKIQRTNQRRSPRPKPKKRRFSQFSEPNKKYHRSILHLFLHTTWKKHLSMKISRITENPSQQSPKPQCILSFPDFLREASDSTESFRDKQSRPAALRTTEQV